MEALLARADADLVSAASTSSTARTPCPIEPLALLQQQVGEALEQMLPEPVVVKVAGKAVPPVTAASSPRKRGRRRPSSTFEILRPDKVTDHLPQALEQPGVEALKTKSVCPERLSQPPLAHVIDPQFRAPRPTMAS